MTGRVLKCPDSMDISTHTLTWSVTIDGEIVSTGVTDFNSHAHVERDMFTGLYARQIYDFNSHAHVERDVSFIPSTATFTISTHTLTWSVTLPM